MKKVDLSTTFFDIKTALPFYITATALGKLGHEDNEVCLTRAAGRKGIVQMIPTLASWNQIQAHLQLFTFSIVAQ